MSGFDDYLRRAEKEMLPMMKDSACSVTLFSGAVDAKLCLEVGAAILFDKPIILVVLDKAETVPGNLLRAARRVIQGDASSLAVQQELQAAINDVVAKQGDA